MRTALRLEPGDDLRRRLEALTVERGWPAAFVIAGIGSLRITALRLADATEPLQLQAPAEILSLCGSLSPAGAHLHMTIADPQGRVLGGHVAAGCEVRTTVELLVEVLEDLRFERVADARTGYPELHITPR
ncbi:PPC domain-containing DNA-binding protein [Methylibium petroleiphilum]|uniref:PPC domain-containing DNA-binding protein n=1 Tax=Methylibium petroleiphilum TaxID=105560 RepID=UPI001AC48F85|nr:PPC domain-containing DNA-binding protein [Methylibium petroleiphilum]MBN9206467.1 DNA-binding protein [Methylibium petroleiphilum]